MNNVTKICLCESVKKFKAEYRFKSGYRYISSTNDEDFIQFSSVRRFELCIFIIIIITSALTPLIFINY